MMIKKIIKLSIKLLLTDNIKRVKPIKYENRSSVVKQVVVKSIAGQYICSLIEVRNKIHSNYQKYFLFVSALLIIGFLLMHIAFTKSYINNLLAHRSEKVVQRLWNKITSDVVSIEKNGISIFYLTYDNHYMAEWGLRFGFSSRAAIHYDIREQKNNPFIIFPYKSIKGDHLSHF